MICHKLALKEIQINLNYKVFTDSILSDSPTNETISNDYLHALWHDKKDNWAEAHKLIQDLDTREAAAIHAYLHRKEGDQWNADYWYRRANTQCFKGSLSAEWENLVKSYTSS
ncbi:MAG: hypothetical protein ABI844_13745 [Saprospiraceae bacterium]